MDIIYFNREVSDILRVIYEKNNYEAIKRA